MMEFTGPGENNYDEDAEEDSALDGPEEDEDPDRWVDEHRLELDDDEL